jgi:PhnB protein
MNAKPIPDGYDSLIPYLIVRDAARAIEFYKELFGAQELLRMTFPDRPQIGHAELKIRNHIFMLADENPGCGALAPQSPSGPAPLSLLLYLPDVDAVFQKAVAMGAKPLQPPTDQFYGDRMARFADPFGHIWSIATHTEDVPPQEMARRSAEWFKSRSK